MKKLKPGDYVFWNDAASPPSCQSRFYHIIGIIKDNFFKDGFTENYNVDGYEYDIIDLDTGEVDDHKWPIKYFKYDRHAS